MARNFINYDYKENNVINIFYDGVEKFGDWVFLRKRDADGWIDFTWNDIASQVDAIASYLINSGMKKGSMTAIYSSNRPEWVVADFASLTSGCVDVTIYPTDSAAEAAYIINDSKSVICFCEGKHQVDNLLAERKNLPSLKKIIVFDDPGYKDEIIITFEDALKEGFAKLQKEEIMNRVHLIKSSDLMTIIYSSGTTGQPKGVMLSYSNIMFVVIKFNMKQNLPEGHTVLSLLPLSHAVERILNYYSTILDGGIIAYSRGPEYYLHELPEIKPNYGVYIPKVFERIYNGIKAGIKNSSAFKRKLFTGAVETGKKAAPYFMTAKPLPLILSMKFSFYNRLVFKRIKRKIGFDRAIGFSVTGGPMMTEVDNFFWGMNVQIRKVYGLTETAFVLNADGYPGQFQIKADGWIAPFPETEIKIAEDGEILVRGPQVMLGYYNRPQESLDMFARDKWFKTGDIGVMDINDYLKITDRKKDIIITAGGRNVYPCVVENAFKAHPFISQALILGDGKKYVAALIVPDFEELKIWAAAEGIAALSNDELVRNPEVIKKYEKIVNDKNQRFGWAEPVKKFRLMPKEFTQEDGEFTPTMMLKRRNIMSKNKALIESIFAD